MSRAKQIIAVLTESKIQLLITLAAVVVTLIGAFITIKLAPLYQNQASLTSEIKAVEEKVKELDTTNKNEHDKLVQRSAFEQLVIRIDHISSRVDSIYSIISRK